MQNVGFPSIALSVIEDLLLITVFTIRACKAQYERESYQHLGATFFIKAIG